MNEIYVVGHRNPDTDSIVAAMSYAALRNALGDRNYVAAYLGHVSDETQRLLDRFGFQPPHLIQNVRTQVSDLDYDTPPALNATVTMGLAHHAGAAHLRHPRGQRGWHSVWDSLRRRHRHLQHEHHQ